MKQERYYPGHPFIESIIQDALNYDHIVVDSFCGMGGFTDGFERTGHFKIIACINHWPVAIDTHRRNHPHCLHIEEDFRTADLSLIKYMVEKIRALKPSIQVHGSFGLECTNFSNAKGGMPRNADSRTLAEHVDRYVIELDFDVIWIENVKEFLMWGPMIPKIVWDTYIKGKKKKHTVHFHPDRDAFEVFENMPGAFCPLHIEKKNKKIIRMSQWMIPDPETKSIDFKRWRSHIKSFGYAGEHRLLNAADYGVPQHRKRLIMQFVRAGIPISWPKPTHHKTGANGLPKWNAIGPCLNLEDIGTELLSFYRNKKTGKLKPRITSPKTIQRLMKGCIRHVLNNRDQFIMKNYSDNDWSKNIPLTNPSGAMTATGGNANLVSTEKVFITKYMGNDQVTGVNNGKSIDEASCTLPTSNRIGVVNANLVDYYFGQGYTKPITDSAGVTGTKDGASVHTMQIVSEFHSRGEAAGVHQASKPILTKDKYSLDTIKFIDQRYSSGQQNKAIHETSGALLSVPKQTVINVDQYIMDTQFNNEATGLETPSRTIPANRKHFYIINAAWFEGHSKPITDASATLIARQDKMPQYLVTTETGELAIEVYPHDPPHYVAFKRFMADHGIVRVTMRMLYDYEMLKIQSFKPDTKLTKSTTDNKKMIGNAVPPEMVEALANAYHNGWKKYTEMEEAA